MSLSAELERLDDLRQRGVLSETEFLRAKERVLRGEAAGGGPSPTANAINALRRSRHDRWLGGVCGGLAQVTGLATWLWRMVFVLLVLCAGGGLLAYALLWVLLPEENLPADDGASRFHAV